MFNYSELARFMEDLKGKPYIGEHGYDYSIRNGYCFQSQTDTVFIEFSGRDPKEYAKKEKSMLAKRDFYQRLKANPLQHLKFHISIDNTQKELPESDFSLGYEIIIRCLAKHKVSLFKVIKPGIELAIENPMQRGKDFTIYCKNNPDYGLPDWIDILSEISNALTTASIQPGCQPLLTKDCHYERADTPISASAYMTYRVEKGDDPIKGKLVIKGPSPIPELIAKQSDDTAEKVSSLNTFF